MSEKSIEDDLEAHRARHVHLHSAFDELAADFMRHHADKRLSNTTLLELFTWSHSQTTAPTPAPSSEDYVQALLSKPTTH